MDIIFNIDGALADASHRLHLIEKEPKDWDAFLSDDQMALDGPIEPIWETLSALVDAWCGIAFITGRPECQRAATFSWLRDQAATVGIILLPRIALYMRDDDDRRPSHIGKEDGLMRARADGYNPTLVFEDSKLDAEMWRRNGLICCQIGEGNY